MKTVTETPRKSTSKAPVTTSRTLVVLCLALAALTFAVFSPAYRCGFINYDDQDYVYENPAVQRGVTWEGAQWAFTATHASNWHPLTWLSHMLDCQLFGLKAGGHHFTNVCLHAGNALLLLLLLRKMTGALWRSAIVAALFALHPLHVESVAWVSERKDVLSTAFGLLSAWFYVSYARRASPGPLLHYSLAILFFAFALMSKPMLVTLPFLFLLLDFWPLRRASVPVEGTAAGVGRVSLSRLFFEKVPFIILSVASCAITILVQSGKTVMTLEQLPLTARLANVVVSYATYIAKAFCPTRLCIFYPLQGAPPPWQVIAAVLVLVAITAVAIRVVKTHPAVITGWLWFLGSLVPVIGIVHVGEQSHADRYTYLPLVGIFVAITWTAAAVATRQSKLIAGVAALILAGCCAASWRQVGFWKDSETVLTRALNVTTDNFLAHNNLGVALAARQQLDEAAAHYREAIRIRPTYARAYSNVGAVLTLQGKLEEAIGFYQKSLQFRPSDAQAHHNLAVTLARLKRYDETAFHCREALRHDPGYWMAYSDLGLALILTGKFSEAAEAFENSLRHEPNDSQIQFRFAQALLKLGRVAEAKVHYDRAVQLDARWTNARFAEQLSAAASNAK